MLVHGPEGTSDAANEAGPNQETTTLVGVEETPLPMKTGGCVAGADAADETRVLGRPAALIRM